ncbi:hypothetical protein [Marivita sp.]|uniref:hypothetical protein n=1 Tax=Marivita sp. TaxID=2003365 RepID=UPI0025C4BB33|nr:hypothetical protein [Marivita sp.]
MTWTDITENWHTALARLEERFPLLNRDALADPPASLSGLSHHLADTHDLTALEATEELADWLFVESLARQASEMGLH